MKMKVIILIALAILISTKLFASEDTLKLLFLKLNEAECVPTDWKAYEVAHRIIMDMTIYKMKDISLHEARKIYNQNELSYFSYYVNTAIRKLDSYHLGITTEEMYKFITALYRHNNQCYEQFI